MAETYPSNYIPGVSSALSAGMSPTAIRTSFDGGNTRQRNRFTEEVERFNVQWTFTDYEYSIFEAFHRTKLSYGNDWFDILLPIGDSLTLVLARFENGRFSKSHRGVLDWTVSAVLEVKDNYGLTESELDAIINP